MTDVCCDSSRKTNRLGYGAADNGFLQGNGEQLQNAGGVAKVHIGGNSGESGHRDEVGHLCPS